MSFFFFNDTATTEIYTLSLHDALPISAVHAELRTGVVIAAAVSAGGHRRTCSTGPISYGLPIHSAIDGSKAAMLVCAPVRSLGVLPLQIGRASCRERV